MNMDCSSSLKGQLANAYEKLNFTFPFPFLKSLSIAIVPLVEGNESTVLNRGGKEDSFLSCCFTSTIDNIYNEIYSSSLLAINGLEVF